MKIKWGALVTDGRNKIGGHVASKNRGGAYLRTKVTPVNPQTTFQSSVRAVFTALSQAWRSLTEANRLAWDSAVSSFTSTDIFGDIKTPTGKNLYQKLNTNLSTVGVAAISTPPLPSGAGSVDSLSAIYDVSAQSVIVTFTPTPVPADTALVLECTGGMSPGRNFMKNDFRVLEIFDAAATSPQTVSSAYLARFGAIVLGQKYGVRLSSVNKLTGEKSTGRAIIVIAVA